MWNKFTKKISVYYIKLIYSILWDNPENHKAYALFISDN